MGWVFSAAPPGRRTSSCSPSGTFVFVLSASALSLVGLLVYFLVGVPPASEAAGQLLVRSLEQVRPEPNERYTYAALTLLAPLVIWTSVRLCRFGSFGPLGEWLASILVLIGILIAIPHESFQIAFLQNGLIATVLVAMIVIIACRFDRAKIRSVTARVVNRFKTTSREDHRRLVVHLCGLSIFLTLTWRIFSEASAYAMLDAFDAFFYSIVQTFYGGTCLGDVLPQYGCYGEILSFVLRPFGLSVFTITLIMALLSCVSLCATFVFAGRLIRSPLILAMAGCWVLIVQNRPLWTGIRADQYFQYTPVRTLFPALSLLIVHSWQRRRSPLKAILIGAFAGLSICWSPDSGAAVSIALLCFLVFSGTTSSRYCWASLRRHLLLSALYLTGLLLALGSFGGWLTVKYGQPLQLADYIAFIHTFYVLGFFMLPMPLPDPWVVAIGCAVLVLVRVAMRAESGPYAPRLERAAYLAVLSVGLFSYFTGRSHPMVFTYVSWPFILLLGYLIDSRGPIGESLHKRTTSALLSFVTVGAFVVAAANISIGIPRAVAIGIKHWRQIVKREQNLLFQQQVEFIRSVSGASAELSVMSVYQGVLLAQIGQRSAQPGPGLVETIRRRDAERQITALVKNGPPHLFIGSDAIEGREIWSSGAPWILDSLPLVKQAYEEGGWDSGRTLLHFVRKSPPGPALAASHVGGVDEQKAEKDQRSAAPAGAP